MIPDLQCTYLQMTDVDYFYIFYECKKKKKCLNSIQSHFIEESFCCYPGYEANNNNIEYLFEQRYHDVHLMFF